MLSCLQDNCNGNISNGQRGRQRYWEGDVYVCPKCRTVYTIGVTDDYEDDAIAYLIEVDPKDLPRFSPITTLLIRYDSWFWKDNRPKIGGTIENEYETAEEVVLRVRFDDTNGIDTEGDVLKALGFSAVALANSIEAIRADGSSRFLKNLPPQPKP